MSDQFGDRTPKQQAVIAELVRVRIEDVNVSDAEIAERCGVDESYPQKVRRDYGQIVSEYVNEQTVPTATDKRLGIDDLSQGGIREEEIDTPVDDVDVQLAGVIASNERITPERLADVVSADVEDIRRVSEQFDDYIGLLRRRKIVSHVESDNSELSSDVREKWDTLTLKQKSTVVELATQQDPLSPEREYKSIAGSAGVHPTYVSEVIDKAGEVAIAIRSSWVENTDFGEYGGKTDSREVVVSRLKSLKEEVELIAEVAGEEIEAGATGESIGRRVVATRVSDQIEGILDELGE